MGAHFALGLEIPIWQSIDRLHILEFLASRFKAFRVQRARLSARGTSCRLDRRAHFGLLACTATAVLTELDQERGSPLSWPNFYPLSFG